MIDPESIRTAERELGNQKVQAVTESAALDLSSTQRARAPSLEARYG